MMRPLRQLLGRPPRNHDAPVADSEIPPTGLAAILVIKFGIGGIWAARDRFWPKVYDALDGGK